MAPKSSSSAVILQSEVTRPSSRTIQQWLQQRFGFTFWVNLRHRYVLIKTSFVWSIDYDARQKSTYFDVNTSKNECFGSLWYRDRKEHWWSGSFIVFEFPPLFCPHILKLFCLAKSLRFHEEMDEPIDTVVPIRKFSQLQASETVQLVGASCNTVCNMRLTILNSILIDYCFCCSCSTLIGIPEQETPLLLSLPRRDSPSLQSSILPLSLLLQLVRYDFGYQTSSSIV